MSWQVGVAVVRRWYCMETGVLFGGVNGRCEGMISLSWTVRKYRSFF